MAGWTAATNIFGGQAEVFGCLLFLWQIPHCISLAVMYRQDYAKDGFCVLPDNPEVNLDHVQHHCSIQFSIIRCHVIGAVNWSGTATILC